MMYMCCACRTVYDLAKETEGIMKLEQETNTLNITFMMTKNPVVGCATAHLHTQYCNFIPYHAHLCD